MRQVRLVTIVFAVLVAAGSASAQQQVPCRCSRRLPGRTNRSRSRCRRRQSDASFDAFRKELAEIVKKKDRAALAGKVVAKGFFWQRAPIASDQLCYRKEDGGWKIAGYIGVGPGQD